MGARANLNTISGKVVLKESGRGIPDLVVAIYDVNPNTEPEERIESPGSSIIGTR